MNPSVRTKRTDVFNYTKIILFVNGITTKLIIHFLVIIHKKPAKKDTLFLAGSSFSAFFFHLSVFPDFLFHAAYNC